MTDGNLDGPAASSDNELELAGLARDALAGRVALVTGAGRGIGRAVARTLAALGARVVVAEVAPTGAEVEQAIRSAGGEALYVRADVSDQASVDELVRQAASAFGPVDILINNAIVVAVAPVEDLTPADWDSTIAVNLRGTFLTCRACLPGMLARGRGVIVNMVSTEAMPGLSAYIASKQGVLGFSQSFAAEVGERGVRVIAFAPGMVDTPGIREVARDLAPRLGMTPGHFFNLSLHSAYEGLIPVRHAAAATAYLVARLADEYHGEVVDGYTVLERAGIITPSSTVAASPTVSATAARADTVQQALARAQQLHGLLLETEAEFERLPVFVRPMARGSFKSRVGVRVQDAVRAVTKLIEQLQRMQASHSGADAEFTVDRGRLAATFERLIAYYEGVPGETARFTRDQELLRRIESQMAERAQVVRQLLAALDAIQA